MAYLNHCTFIGHLTRNPERRVTPKGANVAEFGLGINRTFKDESGKHVQETDFIEVQAWRGLGEICEKYLDVGAPIYLAARYKLQKWEKKVGDRGETAPRSRPVFIATNIQFLNRSGKAAQAPEQASADHVGEDE